jgi:hypothetical protein
MDNVEAVEALPSGCLFSDWITRRGCAKSTAYRMRQELGVICEKRRSGAAVEVWLSAGDEVLMTAYADALGRGLTTAAALVAVGMSSRITALVVESDGAALTGPMESDGPAPEGPVESDGADLGERLILLRRRLAALRDALELGAPLSTAEAALLLGARPGGAEVVRGRIRAVRLRRNLWTLEPD